VLAVSALDFILAVLELAVGVWVLAAASRLGANTLDAAIRRLEMGERAFDALVSSLHLLGMMLLSASLLSFVMGFWIRSGQSAARTVQFVVAGLALLGDVYGIMTGANTGGALLSAALQIVVIGLLAGREASAFFAGRSPPDSPGRTSARGRRRRR